MKNTEGCSDRREMILDALGGVNVYLVEESIADGAQMRDRRRSRLLTIAASAALFLLTGAVALIFSGVLSLTGGPGRFAHGAPGTADMTETAEVTKIPILIDMTDMTETEGTPGETEGPAPEEIILSGVIFRIYDDHTALVGVEDKTSNMISILIPDEVGGVPVTEIADGALDGAEKGTRVICSVFSKAYETAREYAEKNGLVFIESGSGKKPDHFYPDFIEKLEWHERDRTGDRFLAEDDNAEISVLVKEYVSGNEENADELMRRVLFRYASVNMLASYSTSSESFRYYVSDPADQYGDEMTDYDRYDVYLDDEESGDSYAAYRFAYGSITTYGELEDYVKLFYTEDKAEAFLDNTVADIEGEAYIQYTGMGYLELCVNPVFSLEVTAEKITLHEKREVLDNDVDFGGKFTGEYREDEFVLELHDGKWQAPYEPMVMVNYLDMPKVYDSLYS